MKLIMYKSLPHLIYTAGLSFAIGFGAYHHSQAVIARADRDVIIAQYQEQQEAHKAIQALYGSIKWQAAVEAANLKTKEACRLAQKSKRSQCEKLLVRQG